MIKQGCNQSNGASAGGRWRGGGQRFQGTGSGCLLCVCPVGKSIFGLDAHEELMLPVTEMLSSPSLHLG